MSSTTAFGRSNGQQMFGPYYLFNTIGEGEFGKVKLAKHKDFMQREVCVKLIKKENVNNASKRTKLTREISILQSLDHPFIVKLLEVIETQQYIGMVMEIASGGELFEHILARKYLKEKEACRYFVQLISGLQYLHAHKYVHRDLKLENLLLDGNRNIIITDFGFANKSDGKDSLFNTSCGSPCYAAPELVISDGYVGEAADIWSCGVILFAMLCGYLPYDDDPANPDGDNINLLYKYILETELVMPDYLSEDAKHLLKRMLVPDPKYRAKMDEIVKHSWLKPYREILEESMNYMEITMSEQLQVVPDRKSTISMKNETEELTVSVMDITDISGEGEEPSVDVQFTSTTTISKTEVNSRESIEILNLQPIETVKVVDNTFELNKLNGNGEDYVADTTDEETDSEAEQIPAEVATIKIVPFPHPVENAVSTNLLADPQQVLKKASDSSHMSIDMEIPSGEGLMLEIMSQVNYTRQVDADELSSATVKKIILHKTSKSTIKRVPSVALPNNISRNELLQAVSRNSIKDSSHNFKEKIVTEKRKSVLGKSSNVILPESSCFQGNNAKVYFPTLSSEPVNVEPTRYTKSMDVWRIDPYNLNGEKSKFSSNRDEFSQMMQFPTASEKKSTSARTVVVKSKKNKYYHTKLNTPVLNEEHGESLSTFATSTLKYSKLRYHSGPIDQRALTNRTPIHLLDDIFNLLLKLGMLVSYSKSDGSSFKLKVLRPQHLSHIEKNDNSDNGDKLNREVNLKDGNIENSDSGSANCIEHPPQLNVPNHGRSNISKLFISSFPLSLMKRIKYMATHGQNWNKGFDGREEYSCKKENMFSSTSDSTLSEFGLYVVEFKRRHGNIWEFKKLYHNLIGILPLSENGKVL
ncbi:hypothetical protein HDU92_002958 [Lobulomyces angularis]|nr:hypothetical protein HDU92_002958 [Lobulomyces angularis]